MEETEYYNKTDVVDAYRQFMTDLASALTNNTSTIAADVQDIFELEKNISQYHWNNAEQRLRDNETVVTILANVSSSFASTVNYLLIVRILLIFNFSLISRIIFVNPT